MRRRFGERRRYALASFAGQVAFAAIAFIGSVLAARLLGPSGKGEYSAWTAATVVVSILLAGTLPVGLGRAYLRGQADTLLPAVRRHVMLAALSMGALSIALLGLGVAVIPVLACLLVAAPAAVLVRDVNTAFAAAKRAWSVELTRIGSPAIVTVGLAGVALLGLPAPLDIAFALWGAGWLASAGVGALLGRRYFGRGSSLDLGGIRRLGRGSYMANAGDWLVLRADWFIVLWLGGPAALGLYSVAVNWSEAGLYAGNAVGNALFEERKTLTRAQAGRILRRISYFLAGFCAALAAVGLFGVELLFGEDFGAAVWPVFLLAPGIAARGVAYTASRILLAQGSGGTVSRITVLSLVLGAATWSIGTLTYGIIGTAAASSLTYGFQAAATVVALRGRQVDSSSESQCP